LLNWAQAVEEAIRRLVARTRDPIFSRQSLIDSELSAIVAATNSQGMTPHQTLSRELQQLRDRGVIEFVDSGTYRWMGLAGPDHRSASRKGVFVVGSHSVYKDEPERFYRFPPRWMNNALKLEGGWIIYQEPRRAGQRGYYAVAMMDRIVPDPTQEGMHLALIKPGSYLEFGRDVPFQLDGRAVERGLLDIEGKLNNGRAIQSIRVISDCDFNRIIELGLIEETDLLPRVDEGEIIAPELHDEYAEWSGPIDRTTMLVNRTVRDRQFRKRVLDVYECQCALIGMKLINGGGRAEAQAAHIMSVEAGGPDMITNGIALSGTMHWMFDRGLISLSDDGDILLSHKINDIESINKIIYSDRKARIPVSAAFRPHPRYLEWHRRERFYG